MVNVGIVGAGLAGGLHARNLMGFRDVSIGAVCDPEVERARDLAGGCGALACRSVDDLLDAVYVCVPPFAHGEPERAVLARRLPMYVEKPIAADGATAREIASQVARAGVLTQMGFQWRYRAFVPEARETVRREDEGSAMERADRCFVDAVAGGPPDLRSPYHDALRSHELALAIAGSARTGRPASPSG